MEITLRYHASDGFKQSRKFKSLAGARKYSQKMVGKFPEMGFAYAISQDGIGTLHAEGCRLEDLFGDPKPKVCPEVCPACKGTGWCEKQIPLYGRGELIDVESVETFCDCVAGQAVKEERDSKLQEAHEEAMKFDPNDPEIPF